MLMDLIKARHSIRKYTNEQITRDNLETILEAGNFAPNAGGGQRSMMVAIHNKELAAHVGKMNMANFDRTHLAGSFVSKEQPSIGIIFCIDKAEIEYFNLGVNPIFRETYRLGDVKLKEKGYFITESCIGCGICREVCPQRCIEEGSPFIISKNHCLHCGNCYENCPVKAIERR